MGAASEGWHQVNDRINRGPASSSIDKIVIAADP